MEKIFLFFFGFCQCITCSDFIKAKFKRNVFIFTVTINPKSKRNETLFRKILSVNVNFLYTKHKKKKKKTKMLFPIVILILILSRELP